MRPNATGKILVVDDEETMRRSLADILRLEGYEVEVLASGEAAVESLKQAPPDLMLLDLKMPKIDGIEVLRKIKSDKDLQMIPVVILTSSSESSDLETCYQLGANAYVVKPVRFADFVEAVKQIEIFWALINEAPP